MRTLLLGEQQILLLTQLLFFLPANLGLLVLHALQSALETQLLGIVVAALDAPLDLCALDLHLVDLPPHLVDVVLLSGHDGGATTAEEGPDGGEEDIRTGDKVSGLR